MLKEIPKNALKIFLLITLFILINGNSFVHATDSHNNDTVQDITVQLDSIEVGRQIYYSRDYYCVDLDSCESGKVPFPRHIWITSPGGYAGYIPVDEWYISPTHYVVSYQGVIYKGPFVPPTVAY